MLRHVRVDVALDGDNDDVPPSVYSRSLMVLWPDRLCDHRQLATPTELRRLRAHRAAWHREATQPPQRVLCFTEAGAPVPFPRPLRRAEAWLRNGACDVVVLPGGGTHYALHPAVLPRLLELTDPAEINLKALWDILDDLDCGVVVWRLGGGGRDAVVVRGSTNVKRILPDVSVRTGRLTLAVALLLLLCLFVVMRMRIADKRRR